MESNMYQRIPLDKRISAAIRMINRFQVGETVAQISLETGISRTHLYTLEEKYRKYPKRMRPKYRALETLNIYFEASQKISFDYPNVDI